MQHGDRQGTTTRVFAQIARLLTVSAMLMAGRPALALHSGGVGPCEACHSMHNSFEGSATVRGQGVGISNSYLLAAADSSSVCLHCHEAAGMPSARLHFVSTSANDMLAGSPPRQLSPGGDFGWLKKTYTWVAAPGQSPQESRGERHGHNVVSMEYGYLADGSRTSAPGGTYPSDRLSCTSCHDPHGTFRRISGASVSTTGAPIVDSGSYADSPDPVPGVWAVGVYRMLGGTGYAPPWVPGGLAFTSGPPDAVAPRDYNRSESLTQTRVAYGKGMSEWCANCHPNMLRGGRTGDMAGLNHPSGNDARLPAAYVTNYVAYVKTGNVSNIDPTRSYWSLVPFEEGVNVYAQLKAHARSDDSYLNGPEGTANVSCITCHRAHASGFDGGLRFRAGNAFITVTDAAGNPSWPDPLLAPAEAQGRTAAETQQAYYGRQANQYAPFQATLCNKCHVKD